MIDLIRSTRRVMSSQRTGRVRLAAVLLYGTITISNAVAAPAPASLCNARETILFTCPIGHKLVSICSDGTKASYRYGRPGNVEMSSGDLSIADQMLSGGGETQIAARNGSYSYIVYDETSRTSFSVDGHNDVEFDSGLIVMKDRKIISTSRCGSDAGISADAGRVIKPGALINR